MESTGLRGQRLGGETTGHALRVSMHAGGRESLQVSRSMGDEDGGSRTRLLASGPVRGSTLGVTPLNGALGPCQDFEDRQRGL